jgi:hypothetical protein
MESKISKRRNLSPYHESDSQHTEKYESKDLLYEDDFDLTYEDQYQTEIDYSGVGPKGYRRSSERLKEEAFSLLQRNRDLDASEIEVEVKDEIIILKGNVKSRSDKRLAERIVEEIHGIEDVYNFLTINKKPEGWIPGLDSIENKIQGGSDG